MAKLSPQNPYQDAYKLACEALVSADIKERAEKSGATLTIGENGKHLITRLLLTGKLSQRVGG